MIISLGRSATIADMPSHYSALLDGFALGEDLQVDASELVEADLSLVQLLEAARTHAATCQIAFVLTGAGQANAALHGVLERNGFLARTGKAEREFWQLEDSAS